MQIMTYKSAISAIFLLFNMIEHGIRDHDVNHQVKTAA